MKHDKTLNHCSCKKCFTEDLSRELIHNINNPHTLKQLIINGANINYKTKIGWSALFESVRLNLIDSTDALIKLGADIHIKDNHNRTVLLWAIKNNNPKMVQLLLDNGYNLDIDIIPGVSATRFAMDINNIVIFDLLVNYTKVKPKNFKLKKEGFYEYT